MRATMMPTTTMTPHSTTNRMPPPLEFGELDDASSSSASSFNSDDEGGSEYDDDDDYETTMFPEDGLRFTGVEDAKCGGGDSDEDGAGPRIMTVTLPAGRPLAFYAQVEAMHRRSILPHVRILVEKKQGGTTTTTQGGGGASSSYEAAADPSSAAPSAAAPKIGLYRVFRDEMVKRGAREGALRRWLPADTDFRQEIVSVSEDDEDGSMEDTSDDGDAMDAYMRGTSDGYASPEEFVSEEEEEEGDEMSEDEDGDEIEEQPPTPTDKAELRTRLPGTSIGYWAAAAGSGGGGAAAWMF